MVRRERIAGSPVRFLCDPQDEGVARGTGFYDANGIYSEAADGLMNLGWLDRTHASKYGSYLSALTLFGSITGLDPLSLGAGELAAADLGIGRDAARMLQRVASEQLHLANAVPEPASGFLLLAGLATLVAARTRQRAGSMT